MVSAGQEPENIDTSAERLEMEATKRRALALIERAQHNLENAYAELDRLLGAWPEQEIVGKLAEEAHGAWRCIAYGQPKVPWTIKVAYRGELAKRSNEE